VNELRNYPEWNKLLGRPVPLEEMARLDGLASRAQNLGVVGGEGAQATVDEGGPSVVLPPEPSGWGRITGFGPVSGSYTFTELQDDGGFPPQLYDASGAYQGVAYEVDYNPYVPADSFVRVWRADGEHWRFKFEGVGDAGAGGGGSPPTAHLPPGRLVGDALLQLIWLSLGNGLWVAFCPCIPYNTPSGSGSGYGPPGIGGGVFTGCCASVPDPLYAVISGSANPACNRTIKLKHQAIGQLWSAFEANDGFAGWGSCDVDFTLECFDATHPDPYTWHLSPGIGDYTPSVNQCGPPFHLRFVVADDPCGCGPCTVDILP
jgi:hypothetical protein